MVKKITDKQKAYQRGVLSEKIAALFLRTKGYKILAQRYRSNQGEIDIIAQKFKTITFVEVKARQSLEDGLYAISARQRKRIISAAEIWLSTCSVSYDECRFDVVLLTPTSLPTHIKNAFMQE